MGYLNQHLITRYPKIAKCALEIAYDNGMIHRSCPEERFLAAIAMVLVEHELADGDEFYDSGSEMLGRIENFIDTLTDEEINTLCVGEDEECRVIGAKAPYRTTELLDQFFEVNP